MSHTKRIISLIISIIIIFNCSIGLSEQTQTSTVGQFSIINKGDIALFDGVLFDPTATAIILTDKEQNEEKFKIALDYELKKQSSNFKLKIDDLNTSFDASKEENKKIISQKDIELSELRKISLNKSDYSIYYIAGGVLGGVLLTLGTLYLIKKTEN